MIKKISVIGGDLRIVKLLEMLAKDEYEICTYGLEKIENINSVKKCKTLQETVQDADIVIGPIPITSDNTNVNAPFSEKIITLNELATNIKGKKIIAGSIKREFYELSNDNKIETIDLLNREELAVLNAISTAEGAIQIAMEETIKTIHNSNVLILGFGRIGKVLAKMLQGVGANVYCEARKNVDLAWIRAYGYIPIHQKEIEKQIDKYDIIKTDTKKGK